MSKTFHRGEPLRADDLNALAREAQVYPQGNAIQEPDGTYLRSSPGVGSSSDRSGAGNLSDAIVGLPCGLVDTGQFGGPDGSEPEGCVILCRQGQNTETDPDRTPTYAPTSETTFEVFVGLQWWQLFKRWLDDTGPEADWSDLWAAYAVLCVPIGPTLLDGRRRMFGLPIELTYHV
jgi:hypothetical protein